MRSSSEGRDQLELEANTCGAETGMGKEGKDGKKKKSKEPKERTRNEDETTSSALRSVSVKVLREAPETSGCLLACFSDSPAPVDLLDEGADPYKFQCRQMGKSGVRSLTGEKVMPSDLLFLISWL